MNACFRTVCLALLLAVASPRWADAGPIEDARAAVTARPGEAEGYEALGRLQQQAGDLDGAIATWQALIEAVPTYARGRYRLAFALRKAVRLAEAAEAYRGYIERAPEDPDGRFGLAKTLEQMGDQAGALDAYRAYVRLEKRPSEADWVERARASIAELEAAAAPVAAATPAAATASITLPANATRVELLADDAASPRAATTPTADITLLSDTLVARTEPAADADAAFHEGRYAAAAAAYIAAITARPDDPGLHHRAAVAAALAGDFVTAEHHAGLALRLDPGNAAAADLTRIAYAHQRSATPPASADRVAVERALRDGRLRTAARLAEAALAAETAPADRLALLHLRGRALLALGRADEAFAALKAAAALQPPSADLWGELATAARLRGDHDAADALRRIAARIADPAHPLADARPTPQNEERP